MKSTTFGLLASCLMASALGPSASAADIDYATDIKPLLAKRCYACHGALQQKNGLRLDTAALARRGGDSGAAIVPGKPDESLLWRVLAGKADFKMPPEGEGAPLTDDELQRVFNWIAQGASGPRDEQPEPDPREFWSYRPPQRAPLPAIQRREWPVDPLDVYVAAQHEGRGLTPRPDAARPVWLRRVWIDLVGVGPPREVVEQFLADDAPDAAERQVDRLLASPLHGQRWGRHWMDVWRYSDWYGSRGINEIRYSQRHIWRWRDWIVDATNDDQPYDQMLVEMLAGDEVAPLDPNVLRATGFIGRNWYKFDRNVWMFDAVEHTAQAFLALTIRCCRCHDHKYDPISQEDYYRFRAFFEPHDVRTDVFAADVAMEKDATLGMVPKEGVARVFDKQLDAPTYVFQRGDNRYPDEQRKMAPGVPAAFGSTIAVTPVPLPPEVFYPALRPALATDLVRKAHDAVTAADAAIAKADAEVQATTERVQKREQASAAGQTPTEADPAPSFHDDFSMPRPKDWQVVGGQWVHENGKLVQKTVQNFATYVSKTKHPRDFRAKLRYRTLTPGAIRSVGFSFDYLDQGNSQDIYTSTADASQSVQAFHRLNGRQEYPAAGIVKTPLKVGDETVIELTVRGTQLTIVLNGERKLDYVCPVPRRDGTFALWVHDGSAEFLELEIRPLVATLDDLRQARQLAVDAAAVARLRRTTALAEVAAVEARLAAERAKYGGAAEEAVRTAALAASRAERQVTVTNAEVAVLQAEQHVARLRGATAPAPATPPANASPNSPATPAGNASAATASPTNAALADAEKKLAEAQKARAAAIAAFEQPDGKYAPLGEQFPTTSTGRRTALARWMAQPEHPRTTRVAVNHVWLRHFGQGLVSSVANFGLNGDRPTNQPLLDYLAVELADHQWSLKSLHRRMVLSRTYAMTSTDAGPSDPNRERDPNNTYLWRMNSRRMEAEAVRDSVLYAAGMLDTRLNGPEIPEAEGLVNPRRSLYFRLTPNEKMKFLELFDAADPNGCYRRRESVVPQQALALMNSPLAFDAARTLAASLTQAGGGAATAETHDRFIAAAFEQLLGRAPQPAEVAACQRFLADQTNLARSASGPAFPAAVPMRVPASADPVQRAREDLVHVLFSHNDYVTVR